MMKDGASRRLCNCPLYPVVALLCLAFFVGSIFVTTDRKEGRLSFGGLVSKASIYNGCQNQCRPSGSEALPRGIVSKSSNLEMRPLWDSSNVKENAKAKKSLLAIAVGIEQKEIVDRIVKKFPPAHFTVMLFHYDGVVDEWRDLRWSDSVIHVSAINQTKWWFAKRFLHPDIVFEYNYIFLWDEDLEVQNFHPVRYLSIVEEEGLEISQPALDASKSEVHHRITVRGRRTKVHRRIYKLNGGGRCYENSTEPPCTGWVEMMVPVFSKAAWRCAWHMIQNDLIHAWGLDIKLGYCAQGDRTQKVGVVDAEYIVHKGIPTLGVSDVKHLNAEPPMRTMQSQDLNNPRSSGKSTSATPTDRSQVRIRSFAEFEIFKKRWQNAVAEDTCWVDPYPLSKTKQNG